MILHPGRPVIRLLSAILVLIQMAVGGATALAHSERLSARTGLTSQDERGSTALHDELRCPLCQFAGLQAQPLPTYEIAVGSVLPDMRTPAAATSHKIVQPHARPSSRAPPTSLS